MYAARGANTFSPAPLPLLHKVSTCAAQRMDCPRSLTACIVRKTKESRGLDVFSQVTPTTPLCTREEEDGDGEFLPFDLATSIPLLYPGVCVYRA